MNEINTSLTHTRSHRVTLTQEEMFEALAKVVATRAGVSLTTHSVLATVRISNINSGSLRSCEYRAEVTIVEDLSQKD